MRLKGKLLDSSDFVSEFAIADGVADSMTLTNTPIGSNALKVSINGITQTLITDYVLGVGQIDFEFVPEIGSEILAQYIKK